MANVQIVQAAVHGVYGGVLATVKVTQAAVIGGIAAGQVRFAGANVLGFNPSAGSGAVKFTAAKVLNGPYDPTVQGVVRFMRATVLATSTTGFGLVRFTAANVLSESVAPSHRRLYVMVGTTPVAARYGLVQGSTPVYF